MWEEVSRRQLSNAVAGSKLSQKIVEVDAHENTRVTAVHRASRQAQAIPFAVSNAVSFHLNDASAEI